MTGEPVKRMVYSLEARRAPTVSRLALLDRIVTGLEAMFLQPPS